MAKGHKKGFEQHTSDDGLTIKIRGDVRKPEPTTLVVQIPGGHVEVSRCSDNSYWLHLYVEDPVNIIASRVDHTYEAGRELRTIPDFPRADAVKHIALRVANTVPRFDPDSAA